MRKLYTYVASMIFAMAVYQSFGQVIWSEDFSGATGTTPPIGWSNDDITGSGLLWAFDNPGGRTLNSPISAPAAIADSDEYCTGDEESHLVSPVFDLSSYTTGAIFLSFDHYFRSGFGGAIAVEVFNGTTWNSVLSSTTGTTDPKSELIDITTASGLSSVAQVRFKWVGDCSWYWILDNIKVESVTCPSPSNLATVGYTSTSADLTWLAGGTETSWNIEWGAPGFTPGTGTEIGSDVVTGTPSATVNSLVPNTNYQFYVQANCGVGDLSSWAGPISVYTGYCSPSSTNNATYIDNFSTTGGIVNISNLASGYSTGGYSYVNTESVQALAGTSFDFNMAITGGTVGAAIWVDWNNNLQFETSERVYNTTGYGSGPFTSSITIPAGTAAGTYRMRTLIHYNSSNPNDACATNTRLEAEDYDLIVLTVNTPPVPTQEASLPTCTDGTDLSVVGTPGVDETWYWQTTATGTSTANDATIPWTVYENGTYYVRTYHAVYDAWSDADSVVVSNMPTATTPPAPVAAQNPACVPGTEIAMPAAPAGTEYYWQGTSNTSSETTDIASTPYSVTTTGTYYVKAFETATGCWSDAVGVTVAVNSDIPASPLVNPSEFFYCSSETNMVITAVGQGVEATCVASATASGTDNANVTATVSDFSCATGTVIGATLNAEIYSASGTSWCLDWYAMDIVVNGVTVASGVCNQTALDLTPYLPLTSIKVISVDTDGLGDAITIDANVTFTYYGAADYVWYDANTGGNELGNGPINALGTSVLPTADNGAYSFYVASYLDGCTSDRELVTVNVSDVNIELAAIDVSCNNGNDGSFEVVNSACGTAPFTYSVDGGAFGAIPTDLTVGNHTVVVKDNGGNESAPYTITVGNAAAPSGLDVTYLDNDQATIEWIAGGSESSWNIEWGLPGFTPGNGEEVGSATANDVTYTIVGLDGDTEYEIYVSANCGAGTTAGDWISVDVWTDCDPMLAINYCEDFEDISALGCWKVYDVNGDGVGWGVNTSATYSNSGSNSASIYTDGNGGNNDDYLILPRLTLTGNEIMKFSYRARSAGEPNDYRVLLSTTDANPASFNTVLLTDTVSNTTYADTVISLSAHTGNVYIAFHIPSGGLDGWYLYIDDVCFDICNPIAGTDGSLDVCRTVGTVELNDVITSEYTHGTWSFDIVPSLVNGSTLNISTLVEGTYTAEYVVVGGCSTDTTVATINVLAPLSAGVGGTISACKNQYINLFGALTGNVDFGGTWYDASNTVIASPYFQTGTLAGQFVYRYVVSNGICDADTSVVTVDVLTCDLLGVEDVTILDGVSIAPNPNNGLFQIVGIPGSDFTYEVLDLNGRVIRSVEKITSSITNVDIANVERGVYLVRISGNNVERMIRVIKN